MPINILTPDEFRELFPNCKDPEGWINAMMEVFPDAGINTNKRVAAFIAQCGHESGGWRVFSENLNYSGKSLNIIFRKYFQRAGRDVEQYHRCPKKIANVVYANRMGNGDIESGEGWKFRGRGPIQLTGKDNYTQFGKDFKLDVLSNPSIIEKDKKISLLSAIWFWNSNNLNKYSDSMYIKAQTKRINGGYHGLADRIDYFERIMKILSEDVKINEVLEDNDVYETILTGNLKRGSFGGPVMKIQEALGLIPDGIFGKGTELAVKRWQRRNKLVVDGIVGPKTLGKLLK